MKRFLFLYSSLVLGFLLGLGYLAALGASSGAGAADGSIAALDAASDLLRERYGSTESPQEKGNIRAVAELLDRATAESSGREFSRRNVARGLAAFAVFASAVALSTLAGLWLFSLNAIAAPLAALSRNLDVDLSVTLPRELPERGIAEIRSLYASSNALSRKLGEFGEQVREAERETVGRFLVHEINNLLTPIPLALGVLKSAGRAESAGAAEAEAIGIIETQAGDIGALLDRFRQTYRFPAMAKSPCRLLPLVAALPQARDPRVTVEGDAGIVCDADLRFVSQALGNLVANALDACSEKPGNGAVRVVVGRDGDRATVSVIDTGAGMVPGTAGRAFGEWFTTKRTGMGLGLPFALRVARAHGGDIAMESEEGKGSVCTMTMRIAST